MIRQRLHASYYFKKHAHAHANGRNLATDPLGREHLSHSIGSIRQVIIRECNPVALGSRAAEERSRTRDGGDVP